MIFWLTIPLLIIYVGLIGVTTGLQELQGEKITWKSAFLTGPWFVICELWRMLRGGK